MKQRLLALDVLRGLTIGGMILVNSPGTWSYVYPPLLHSRWNGLTLADVIFPLFMFMMGMSMYISLKKFSFSLHRELFLKILRRTFLIFIIGTGIYATSTFLEALREASLQPELMENPWQAAFSSLAHVRILGVLQRLALCYGIGSLLVTTIRHRYIPYLIAALLIGYYVILLAGNGFVYGPENILSHADKLVLGTSHMYNDRGIDPEGVLSTIPSIAQVLIGFCFGKICLETPDMKDKLNRLFLYGSICLILGFLLQDICPLNKKVWSPTFVMVTCGFSVLLLSILLWYIDVTKRYRKTQAFEIFGVNPLFCYVLSEILYILADNLPLKEQNMHDIIYAGLSGWLGDNAFTSFVYAFLFVGVVWLVGAFLYKKRIYIKI
ncbi:acyltransferase family protein [Phocaeicola sp.]